MNKKISGANYFSIPAGSKLIIPLDENGEASNTEVTTVNELCVYVPEKTIEIE